jgi:hypothetical protein
MSSLDHEVLLDHSERLIVSIVMSVDFDMLDMI